MVFFVALTYDDDHLPASVADTVRPRQLFQKRLRKAGLRFRFAATTERGSQNNRLHHHYLIFIRGFVGNATIDSVRALIEKTWQQGFVDASVPYSACRS